MAAGGLEAVAVEPEAACSHLGGPADKTGC